MAHGLSCRPPEHRRATAGRPGDSGSDLPIDATGRRIPLVKDVEYIEIEGGPRDVGWTHPDEVDEALLKLSG